MSSGLNQHPSCTGISKESDVLQDGFVVTEQIRILAYSIMAISTIQILGGHVLFNYLRTRYDYLEKRSRSWITMTSVGVYLAQLNSVLFAVIPVSSTAAAITFLLPFPILAMTVPMRLFDFYVRYAFSYAAGYYKIDQDPPTSIVIQPNSSSSLPVKDQENQIVPTDSFSLSPMQRSNSFISLFKFPKNNQEGQVSFRRLERLKYMSKFRFRFMYGCALLLPYIVMYFYTILTNPVFHPRARCVRATMSISAFVLILVGVAFFFIFSLIMLRYVRNLPDPYRFVHETRLYFGFGILVAISFTLAAFVGSEYRFVLGVACMGLQFVVLDYQVFYAILYTKPKSTSPQNRGINDTASPISSPKSSSKLQLEATLQDSAKVKDFEAFLAGEFAVESLKFYQEVENFNSMFADLTEATRLARARKIYHLYIFSGSLFEININSTLREKMIEDLKQSEISCKVSRDLFEEAKHEVKLLMLSPHNRYFRQMMKKNII